MFPQNTKNCRRQLQMKPLACRTKMLTASRWGAALPVAGHELRMSATFVDVGAVFVSVMRHCLNETTNHQPNAASKKHPHATKSHCNYARMHRTFLEAASRLPLRYSARAYSSCAAGSCPV
jgi:hypothetical protein